jgi:hypothetical protein
VATSLDAARAQVEVTDRNVPLVVTIRDGRDVVVVQGTAGELLALAQSLRSVVEATV